MVEGCHGGAVPDGRRVKYLVGDICLNNYLNSDAMYFNKDIYESNYGDADELYKLVVERQWTYDKLGQMAEEMYNDLNGDGAVNTGDIYGLIVDNFEYVKHMEYSSDFTRYVRNEEGYPAVDYDAERAGSMLTAMNKLLYETQGVTYLADKHSTAFYAGRMEDALSANLREMEADYGIIPYPL